MRIAAILLIGAGCKAPAAPPEEPKPIAVSRIEPAREPEPPDPAASLEAIERALLDTDFAVRFDVHATGKIEARLVGLLQTAGDRLALQGSGTFAGVDVELVLTTEGDRLVGKGARGRLDVARPAELKDAVVIGLVRMGILHNLALLVSGRPPDHADGGVRDWVEAANLEPGDGFAHPDTERPDADALSYGLIVDGQPSGDATLWWDARTNLPVARNLTVHFDDGDMKVTETYDFDP